MCLIMMVRLSRDHAPYHLALSPRSTHYKYYSTVVVTQLEINYFQLVLAFEVVSKHVIQWQSSCPYPWT